MKFGVEICYSFCVMLPTKLCLTEKGWLYALPGFQIKYHIKAVHTGQYTTQTPTDHAMLTNKQFNSRDKR